ncbi:uncharacterized, partial [Tachysurus ichikawai]
NSDAEPYHARRQDDKDRRDKDLSQLRDETSVWQNPLNSTSLIKSLAREGSRSSRHLSTMRFSPLKPARQTDKPDLTALFTRYNIPLELYNV